MPEPAAASGVLLPYRFTTEPSPLQVSTAEAASPGTIDVAVGPDRTVYCRRIRFRLPIGDGPGDLTADPAGVSVTSDTAYWTVSAERHRPGERDGHATFVAVCTSDVYYRMDYDVRFRVRVAAVDRTVGTFGLEITEWSGHEPDTTAPRTTTFDFPKVRATSHLTDVVTTAVPPGHPVGEFARGEPIRLAWSSNAARFAVYAGTGRTPIWTGTDTSTVLTGGVTRDTTLIVEAAGVQGVLTAATTVTVKDPRITPSAVAADTLRDSDGTAWLTGVTAASTDAATLHVGDATAPARVAGDLTATGGATLYNRATAPSATVRGALTAQWSTLGTAAASSLTVTRDVSMMRTAELKPGVWVAGTDCLVVGSIWWPSYDQRDLKCEAHVYLRSEDRTVWARGGNVEMWRSGSSSWMWVVGNTCVLPVPAGRAFEAGVDQLGANQVRAPWSFHTVTFGRGGAPRALDAEEAAAHGLSGSPSPPREPAATAADTADRLTSALADVLGDRLTPALRRRLSGAVRALAEH